MEQISGSIFIRPNLHSGRGHITQRHTHNFDHTTFATRGWWLMRAIGPEGQERINQFCSPEYRIVRELQLKYEPSSVLRPVRFPDRKNVGHDGIERNQFHIEFIAQNEAVPEGAEEIAFKPAHSHRLIAADWEHEFVLLSEVGEFSCVYSHRTPQGDVTEIETGWIEGYN